MPIQLSHLTHLFLASITYYCYFSCQVAVFTDTSALAAYLCVTPVVSQVSPNTAYSTSGPDGSWSSTGKEKVMQVMCLP